MLGEILPFLILKHLFSHKVAFTSFIHGQYPRVEGEPLLLTDEH
jgi:hypothetical protein